MGFPFPFLLIWQIEGFCQNIKLSSNLFFLKSEQVTFLIICHFLLLKKLYNRTFGKALFENLYLTIEKIRTMNLPQPSFQTQKSETHHSSTIPICRTRVLSTKTISHFMDNEYLLKGKCAQLNIRWLQKNMQTRLGKERFALLLQ